MAGITRQKQRGVVDTNLVGATEGVLQRELLAAFNSSGDPVGFAIGPMVPGNTDATTPANTLPVYKFFTAALKDKLDGIEAGAEVNPPAATSEEIANLSETGSRLISPAQLGDIIGALGASGVEDVNGDTGPHITLNLGNIPEVDDKIVYLQAERDKLATVQAYASDDQTGTEMVIAIDSVIGTDWHANSATVYTAPVNMTFIGPQASWASKPVSSTPAEFTGAPTRYRVDARNAVSIQLSGSVNIAADGTHRLLLQYNITADSVGEGGTWVTITGSDISIATTGDKQSTVATFPVAAKIENCWIRLAGDAATGTVQSPKFTQVRAVMTVAVNTAAAQSSTARRRVLSIIPPATTYTAAPVGVSEWRSGGGIGETTRWFVDFSRCSQYQIKFNSGASANGCTLTFDYSTDGGSTWTALSGASINAYSASTTDKTLGWLAPPSGIGACLVRMNCNNTTAGTISPALRGVYMVLDETVATPFSVPATAVLTQPVSFGHAANISWVIPTDTNELLGFQTHIPVDLRKVTDICLALATAVGAPAAGTTAQLEYSTDDSTWLPISGTAVAIDGAIGQKMGSWAAVPSDARVPDLVWLRCTVTASTGATSSFRMTAVMLRQEITVILPSSGGTTAETTIGEIASTTTGTITGPDYDVVLCYNSAAISVNLPGLPRKTQVYFLYGAAITFFGGTGQTLQGSSFTAAAGTLALPTNVPFMRRPSAPTVWCTGRAS